MDIKQIPGQNPQQPIESGKSNKAAVASEQADSQQKHVRLAAEDRVDLSDRAEKLEAALTSLKSVADVNTSKVATLKGAIDAGTYQVNAESTADKLLKFEASLPE